jgi:hypothetical protein
MRLNNLPSDYILSLKKDKDRIRKINFIYLFLMGMTNSGADKFTMRKEEFIDKMKRGYVYVNYYSGMFYNSYERSLKEYER